MHLFFYAIKKVAIDVGGASDIAKIIKLREYRPTLYEHIEDTIKEMKSRNIDNITIACKDKSNNEVVTSYYNLDLGERQELLGHIQADITHEMIKQNIDEYVETIQI